MKSPSTGQPERASAAPQHAPSNRLVDRALQPGAIGVGPSSLGPEFVLTLQHSAGNAAVARWFDRAGPQVTSHDGGNVIFRYLDDYPADAQDVTETTRRQRFLDILDNAIKAGIPASTAENAALTALNFWGGWTHTAVGDFDYAYINGARGFKTALAQKLQEVEEAARTALLDAVFSAAPDEKNLRELGSAAGFVPGATEDVEVALDPSQEPAFVDWFADWFDTKGNWKNQGDVFRKLWDTATPAHKNRMIEVLLGDDGETNVRLSDIDYLIEAVTGYTPANHHVVIMGWFTSGKRQNLFDYLISTGDPGYKTKYMTPEEREEYRLDISGQTISMAQSGKPLVGSNIFVLSQSQDFYGGAKRSGRGGATGTGEAIHHSSFMAGAPVHGAGHFQTTGTGELYAITDQSGHYAPTEYDMGFVLYVLAEEHGTQLAGLTLSIRNNQHEAEAFLGNWKQQYLESEESPAT